MITLSAGTLVVAYFMGHSRSSADGAPSSVVLMGTCPGFILMSKVDYGPIVVALLLTVCLLLAFFRYLNTGRGWRRLWTASIHARPHRHLRQAEFCLARHRRRRRRGSRLYRRRLSELARGRSEATAVAVGAFVLALLLFLAAFIVPNLSQQGSSSLQDPLPHLVSTWRLYEHTVGCWAVLSFFIGRPFAKPVRALAPVVDLQWVLALPTALGVLALRRRQGALPDEAVPPAKGAIFFLVVFVMMLVEIAATRQATYPHHVIELLPYPTLVMLCSFAWRR